MTVRTEAAALALLAMTAPVVARQPDVTPIEPEPAPKAPEPDLGDGRLALDPGTLGAETLDDADDWSVRQLNVYWENDGTVPKLLNDSDRHYTNGTKFEIALTPSEAFARSVRTFGDRFDPMPDADVGFGVNIAQHIYTAFDIRVSNPPATARPYAGYLALGVFVQRSSGAVHDHLELNVGVVGEWSGAEATQKFIHAAFPNQDKPRGWGTQLANELAVNLRYQRSWRFQKASIGRLELDGVPRVGFDLGNVFVRANADITFRLGYNLPDDFGPGRLLDYTDVTGSWGGEWGVYTYVRAGARAVAHNIFLDGNTFANSRSVDKRPVVASITAGVMGRYRFLEAGWSVTWLSEEFDTQGNGDSYGTLFARLSFPF